MVDRFTKSVLSLFAAPLFWIAFGPYILPSACAQFGVIRAIDRGASGRWDPVKVSRVD